MSRGLRYNRPELADRLAAQYVAGEMTPLVRRRMETLLPQSPVLVAAVEEWASRLQPLQQHMPERAPAAEVWAGIERRLDQLQHPAHSHPKDRSTALSLWQSLWSSLLLWRSVAVASVVMVVLSWTLLAPPAVSPTPSYLAPLSSQSEVALVVSGYQGTEPGSSWLSLQWSSGADRPEADELHLWAETGEGRELVYLGSLQDRGTRWSLDAEQWQAIKYSHRLFVNEDPEQLNIELALLEGPCLQIGAW